MKTKNIKVLEASEGYYLTLVESVPLLERVVAKVLYLNEDVADVEYKEIPEDAGDLIIKSQEEELSNIE